MKRIIRSFICLLLVFALLLGTTACGDCEHIWQNGVCVECKQVCVHSYANGICTVCGYACAHAYSNGRCTICGVSHTAHSYADGVCSVCGVACVHSWTNGLCTACGRVCTHNYENNVCTVCGLEDPTGGVDLSYREERSFVGMAMPSNQINENELPSISALSNVKLLTIGTDIFSMVSGDVRLDFVKVGDTYQVQLVSLNNLAEGAQATEGAVMCRQTNPAQVYIKANSMQSLLSGYQSVQATRYGYLAKTTFVTDAGSTITVEDRYYFPKENEEGTFNIRKAVICTNVKSGDSGFASAYAIDSVQSGNYQWFVPNNIFGDYPSGGGKRVYRETQLGLPMMMMRNNTKGYTVSLSRYQPVIHYTDNCYASLTSNNDTTREIEISYPATSGNRLYHTIREGAQDVFDMSLRGEITDSFSSAISSVYNAHFNLQNQRIVATDIDEVYSIICQDYKTFLHTTEQENEDTGKKYTSYGLPWRITIQDGEFGPLTYQAGFIGQQLPSAYNMMLYGIMNNDLTSLQNGVNVIDFWVSGAEFMSLAGVPYIWYDTWADEFRAYPCFTRMAVDAMEGLLDAYRLAEAHGIHKSAWYDALIMFADFLVYNQNDDGSYYRCYNYDGGVYNNWDNGIEEPTGNICQSSSKNNTTMPVRFLGKMYELTEEDNYKQAAIKAGNYVYEHIYPTNVYAGGTCDNPNAVDKEAGVFAIYCYDTMYMLTGEAKWIDCLKQAVAFTMSTVQCFNFPVRDSNLKAAYPLEYGYNDGMSFIVCNSSGVDNYIAYLYYELFRVYVLTGDVDYLAQAEFIQQNTKSIMNWDDTLGYKYKSLVAEASTVFAFSFSSASDGAWVTWSSVANAEPIAKMMTNFGNADVAVFTNTDIQDLRTQLNTIGIGGGTHKVYENTVADKLEQNN